MKPRFWDEHHHDVHEEFINGCRVWSLRVVTPLFFGVYVDAETREKREVRYAMREKRVEELRLHVRIFSFFCPSPSFPLSDTWPHAGPLDAPTFWYWLGFCTKPQPYLFHAPASWPFDHLTHASDGWDGVNPFDSLFHLIWATSL